MRAASIVNPVVTQGLPSLLVQWYHEGCSVVNAVVI